MVDAGMFGFEEGEAYLDLFEVIVHLARLACRSFDCDSCRHIVSIFDGNCCKVFL